MGFVLSQEGIKCKDNTHFSISILCQYHSKVSCSFFFGGEVKGSGTNVC